MNFFDIEQLRSFVVAIDTGSLTAAAPLRCLSQSAISEQIRKLEQRANQTLLMRGKNGVSPTLAGKKLLPHARSILALSETAWYDLQGVPMSGELHLGITDYCQPKRLAKILANLSIKYPQLKLRTTVGKSAEIESKWKNQEIDIAIVMRHSSEQKSTVKTYETLLSREDMLWVGNKISTEEPLPLVLLPEDCSIHQMVIKTLKKAHIPYFIKHIASGVQGIQSAIDARLGLTCVNFSSLPHDWEGSDNLSFLPRLPKASFFLLSDPDRSTHLGEISIELNNSIKNIFSEF